MFRLPRNSTAAHALRASVASVFSLLALCSTTLGQSRPAPGTGPASLYYLSIGIGEYDGGAPDLPEAEDSAKLVAAALQSLGARGGILLTSDSGNKNFGKMVTRNDIRQSITDLKRKIRTDNPDNPIVFLYIMGHGYGDPDMQMLFIQPSDEIYGSKLLSQTHTISIIHRSIWNMDIISSLNYFRSSHTMMHFDDFFPGDLFIDPNDPFGSLNRMMTVYRRLELSDAQNRAQNAYLAGGNPPVPYIALFDNCFTSIEKDLAVDANLLRPFMQSSFEELTEEGLAYYAIRPGIATQVVDRPEMPQHLLEVPLTTTKMGPLARRFIELADPGRVVTLEQFEHGFDQRVDYFPDGGKPFSHGGTIVADTKNVEIFPGTPANATAWIDVRFGTGR